MEGRRNLQRIRKLGRLMRRDPRRAFRLAWGSVWIAVAGRGIAPRVSSWLAGLLLSSVWLRVSLDFRSGSWVEVRSGFSVGGK